MRVIRLVRALLRRFRATRSAPPKPGRLAFAAVSSEPALLQRLPRDQACRLAEQAGMAAQAVIGGLAPGHHDGEARLAASRVLRVVRDFTARDRVCGGSVDEMVLSAQTHAPDGLGGLLRAIEADLPRLTEGTARVALVAVVALGCGGLRRIERADAERLMLAASRRAAVYLRDGARPVSGDDGEDGSRVAAALRIVGEVCGGWRTLPIPLVLTGSRRERAEHLVELWRDGAVCAERAEGGKQRLWEDARDGHAFGAVWLLPQMLSMLTEADAARLSHDARAAAHYVLRRGAGHPGARGAMEAARAVLFSCGTIAAPPVRTEPEAVRSEALPARAAHA